VGGGAAPAGVDAAEAADAKGMMGRRLETMRAFLLVFFVSLFL
jgi:hypothetical protein